MGDQGFFAAAWALFTKFIVPWLPGALGSAIAIWFMSKGLNLLQITVNFVIGLIILIYTAPWLIEALNAGSESAQDAIKLGTGMFGYTLAKETFKDIPNLKIISTIKDKITSLFPDKK